MRPASRLTLPIAIAVALVAFALALLLLLDPSSRSHGGSSAASSQTILGSAADFDGAALPTNVPVHEFTLTDQSGRAVALRAYRGRVTVLAFLYSTCGATCIVIAEQIRGAIDELPAHVPVLLISADPAVDTTARVRRFLARASLTGRVRYLSGPAQLLRSIWRAYGVVPASSGHVAFDRAASVLLLDRDGRERVIFGIEQLTPEGLAHDVRQLQSEPASEPGPSASR